MVRPKAAAGARAYTVRNGDTLWDIARTKLGDGDRWPETSHVNHLLTTQIYTGQVLTIPPR